MKTKHLSFINLSNKVILFLLSLLGFSTSCDKLPGMEYGVPNADFIINGTVKSQSTNQVIKNIQVITTNEKEIGFKDTLYTDSQGKFVVKIIDFPTKQTYTLKILDFDGTNNGSFANKDTTIIFDGINFTGGNGHWYKGKAEQNVVIYLTPKK